MAFVHLHVHTQYSILDGFSTISTLFDRAEQMGMPALAITDHGNMYGVKEFFKFANKHMYKDTGHFKVKPIIGCEVNVTRHYDPKIKDSEHRSYYHLILLAKNFEGYKNLMKIVSLGHIEGLYYGKPRVSHEIIEKYHEHLICCSACLAGEIPKNIVAGKMDEARKAIEWHKRVFGDDYYLEVMLHKTEVPGLSLEVYEEQKISNEGIFQLAQEMGVKVVATNDVHFVNKEDGPAHDHLICLNTGKKINEEPRLHYTQQEYLKSEEEMASLFPDHPEVLENTLEIASKVEEYQIDRDHVSRVITFGTMLAKDAIKNVARIHDLSIDESNRLSGMVPYRLSEKVEKEYPFNPKLDDLKPGFKVVEKEVEVNDPDNPGQKKTIKKTYQRGKEDTDVKITLKNCYRLVPEFREELENGTEQVKEVLKFALQLEGCILNARLRHDHRMRQLD